MAQLSFECVDVCAERYAAGPTLLFRVRITEAEGLPVHSIALRCLLRIEPQRRGYGEREEELLGHLFGDRWGETLRPMRFSSVSVLVPGFVGSAEVDIPVACTYDMEVASGKYFHALQGGVVPLVLLFSGTLFTRADNGFRVQQVPCDHEARCPMPIEVWQDLMNGYFPNRSWIMLDRDTVDALLRYKSNNAIPTWDAAVEELLNRAGEPR